MKLGENRIFNAKRKRSHAIQREKDFKSNEITAMLLLPVKKQCYIFYFSLL